MAVGTATTPSWVHEEKRYHLGPNVGYWNLGRTVASDRTTLASDGKPSTYLRQVNHIDNPKTVFQHVDSYLGKTSNLYHAVKGVKQVIDIGKTMKPSEGVGKVLNGASSVLGAAKNVLIFPRIVNTISNVAHDHGGSNWVDKIRNWTEMVGSLLVGWMVLAPIFGKSARGSEIAGPVCDLVSDSLEAGQHAQKLVKNTKLFNAARADGAPKRIIEKISEDRNINIFKVIKCIAGVAGAVFSLLALALGAPVIPAVVLLIVGLVGTIFSITSGFYESSRKETLLNEPVIHEGAPLLSKQILPPIIVPKLEEAVAS